MWLNGAAAVLYYPKMRNAQTLSALRLLRASAQRLRLIKSATMALGKSKIPPRIRGLNEVGRYAIGIQWTDGHESIFPLENLRRGCLCNECANSVRDEIPADAQRLLQLSRLGDAAVYLAWVDGHETLYTMAQLREICRCALCVQEPERPITGG
jgi:DUF971 family protein